MKKESQIVKNSDIHFNFDSDFYRGKNLTFEQSKNLYKTAESIIESLDEGAMSEILSGNKSDIDNILKVILEETNNVIHTKNTTISAIKTSSFGYLDKLSKNLDTTLKKLSFNYFLSTVFQTFDIDWFHLEWGNLIQLYRKLCIIAARGHSKSYTFSHIYPIWRMYQYDCNSLNKEYLLYKRGMLITNEFGLAKTLLGIIRETVEENQFLREYLLPVNRETWSKEEITCKNGANFKIKSYGSKMRGHHPGYIILDDFLNDSVIWSREQKEKLWQVFIGVIRPLLLKNGHMLIVGTPFVEGDLYDKLKKDEAYKVFEYPAIFPDGKLLWKANFDFKTLMEIKNSIGSVSFSREYLVKPISEESTIFPWDVIKRAFIGMDTYVLVENAYSFPKKFDKIVVGTDFAISSSIGADYSVFITVGCLGDEIWILNIYREKGMSYDKQMAKLKQINSNFYPQIIVIESNQMQKIFYQMAQDAGLPVIEHSTGADKFSFTEGLPAMAVLFEQNKIKLPRGDQQAIDITDILCSELASYTFDADKNKIVSIKGHGDISMALWQAIRGSKYAGNGFTFSFL